jgi:hypothetical protein
VKIKKRDYQAMMARIKELQAISDAVITAEIKGSDGAPQAVLRTTLGNLYRARRFAGDSEITGWISAPVRITLDTNEPDVTGYDMYLANKYSSPDDSPIIEYGYRDKL